MTTTRAITLKQPWAGCVLADHKDVENRERNIIGNYRGELAIHAGKTFDHGSGAGPMIKRITGREHLAPEHVVFGAVQGLVTVTGVHRRSASCCTSPWATTSPWHIEFAEHALLLPEPVPCRGFLGVWALPEDVHAAVLDQLDRLTVETAVRDVIAEAGSVR